MNYKVTFYKDGKAVSTCYLNEGRAQRALAHWMGKGSNFTGNKEEVK